MQQLCKMCRVLIAPPPSPQLECQGHQANGSVPMTPSLYSLAAHTLAKKKMGLGTLVYQRRM